MGLGRPREVPIQIIFDHEAFGEIVAKCESLVESANAAAERLRIERRKVEKATRELNKAAERINVLQRRPIIRNTP